MRGGLIVSAATDNRPKNDVRVLCVDDERRVLEGIASYLRLQFTVITATNAADALAHLEECGDVDVIISDMRMPNIDGVNFLARARALAPRTSRIVLTGYADAKSAANAVNDGEVFRFLMKPCPPQVLIAAVEAAAAQTRLRTAEKALLEQTLKGAVQALADVLALADPELFGHASRLRQTAGHLARRLGWSDIWQVEEAALLSQVALVSVPKEAVRRWQLGESLTASDQQMIDRLPEITDGLLASIPRLEVVRAMIARHRTAFGDIDYTRGTDADRLAARGAQLLRAVLDLHVHLSRGMSVADALAALRADAWSYDPAMVEALTELSAGLDHSRHVIAVTAAGLLPGMTLAEDLITRAGVLLVQRGSEITPATMRHVRNYRAGTIREPIHVFGHQTEQDAAGSAIAGSNAGH